MTSEGSPELCVTVEVAVVVCAGAVVVTVETADEVDVTVVLWVLTCVVVTVETCVVVWAADLDSPIATTVPEVVGLIEV